MPPKLSVAPVQRPGTTPGVVSKLRHDVLNFPVALTVVWSPLEELDVGPDDAKVVCELIPNFDGNLLAEATKRPLRPLSFEFRNRHERAICDDHAFSGAVQAPSAAKPIVQKNLE